jgi:hypothetical protein
MQRDQEIKWLPATDIRTVEYRYRVHNDCNEPIKCMVEVQSGYVPRDAASDDMSDWTVYESKKYEFTVKGGEDWVIDGKLQWWRTEHTMPRLHPDIKCYAVQ